MHSWRWLIALLLLGLVVPGSTAEDAGITVAGNGEVKAKPTEVEISAVVTGEAELANDAIVKYRDARKRAMTALDGMKSTNLKIEPGGYCVQQAVDPQQAQMMMQGRTGPMAKPRVQVSETLKLKIIGADKMEADALMDLVLKAIDAGRDAGLQIGAPSPQNYYQMQIAMQNGQGQAICEFKVGDATAVRQSAYKSAMDDARSKAQRLADLAGVKLGRISAIRDSQVMTASQPYARPNAGQEDADELTSALFSPVSIKVSLTVHFEIEK